MPLISELEELLPPVPVVEATPPAPAPVAVHTPGPAKPPKGRLELEDLELARDTIIHRIIEKIPKATGSELSKMLQVVEDRITERRAKGAKTAGEDSGSGREFSRAKALEMLQGRKPK